MGIAYDAISGRDGVGPVQLPKSKSTSSGRTGVPHFLLSLVVELQVMVLPGKGPLSFRIGQKLFGVGYLTAARLTNNSHP